MIMMIMNHDGDDDHEGDDHDDRDFSRVINSKINSRRLHLLPEPAPTHSAAETKH